MRFIKLAGQELPCLEEMPAGMLLDLADATAEGGIKVLKAYREFIYLAVLDEHREELDTILHDRDNPITLDVLNEAIGDLMVEYVKRPSQPRSHSPVGSQPTERSSRVVSLSPVTEETEAALSKVGQ